MTANLWQQFAAQARARYAQPVSLESQGRLTRLTGLVLEASGLRVPVGAQCHIQQHGQEPVLAEVVGFAGDRAYLMPAGDIQGLASGAMVVPAAPFVPVPQLGVQETQVVNQSVGVLRLPMGDGLLGRVLDSQGNALDHGGALDGVVHLHC